MPSDWIWFLANHDRDHRLRQADPSDAPGVGADCWTIVRRERERLEFVIFDSPVGPPPDDEASLMSTFDTFAALAVSGFGEVRP